MIAHVGLIEFKYSYVVEIFTVHVRRTKMATQMIIPPLAIGFNQQISANRVNTRFGRNIGQPWLSNLLHS
ncbi:MAG: hypothetical protein JWM16_2341 [Verrucomicrobiales bacterium]|nr:hypothetical protein [Verrucomicrobiales bacterium]